MSEEVLRKRGSPEVAGALHLRAEISLHVDGSVNTMAFSRLVPFDAFGWEDELVWQVAQIIVSQHGGKAEAIEALESTLAALRSSQGARKAPPGAGPT